MITIVDYGSGNVQAIKNIYKRLNVDCVSTSSPQELKNASKIILAGVGAFDDSMQKLNKTGLREVLDELVLHKKIPVLGICVGMQIMAKSSEEGLVDGLGWIDADVKFFDDKLLDTKPKIPHMGWNSIGFQKDSLILNNINNEVGFYFLHSYFIRCNQTEDILTTTEYGESFTSSLNRENIFGCQFHPEKSHSNGIQFFYNFSEI